MDRIVPAVRRSVEPCLAPKKLGITSTASDRHPAEDPSCSNHPPSFRELVDRIRCYVAEETEKPLELRVSSGIAHSLDVRKGLGGRYAEYEDGILTISPMPSRLHNSCGFWFAQTWEEKMKPLLSSSEAAGVQTGLVDSFLRKSRHDDVSLGKKPSLTKEPDHAWGFCKPSPGQAMSRTSPVPRIVLEAGVTETPEELAVDVEQWLKETNSVQLVFIVKISETRPTDENSPGRTERIGDLKARFGCGETAVSQSSDDSEEAQDGIAKALVVDDWVGPLTAYCEAWERFGDGYRRRGRRVELLPNLIVKKSPHIKVLDLVPREFIDPAAPKSRKAVPDFENLRQKIMAAKSFQAERRAWDCVRQ